MPTSDTLRRVAPVLLGTLGAFAIAVGTSRYGAGLTTDSAFYISTADNLLAGNGYRTFQGHALQHFAPLYPTLLALPGIAGANPFAAARWIDIVCSGLLNYVTAAWLFTHLRSGALALAASIAILCAVPLQAVLYSALSEPLFLLFLTLTLLDLDVFVHTDRRLWRAGLFGSLASLTRYAGLPLVVAGSIIVLARRRIGLAQRIRDAVLFAILCTLPTVPWFLRNYRASHVIGDRATAATTFNENVAQVVHNLSTWLAPARLCAGARMVLLGGAVLLTGYAGSRRTFARHAEDRAKYRADDASLLVFFAFPVIYVAVVIVAATRVAIEAPADRYLAPVYVPLALGVAILFDRAGPTFPRRAWRTLGLLIAFWLAYPVGYTVARLHAYAVTGPGEFGTRPWRESALMRYLSQHRFADATFTNEPYAVYLLTGQTLGESPTKHLFRSLESPQHPSELDEELRAGRSAHLVWFRRSTRDDLFGLDELGERYRLDQVASLDDGAIYAVTPVAAPSRATPAP